MHRLTIEVTEEELRMLRSFCLLRPIKYAIDALRSNYRDDDDDIADDLSKAGPIFENIRHKLVEASRK